MWLVASPAPRSMRLLRGTGGSNGVVVVKGMACHSPWHQLATKIKGEVSSSLLEMATREESATIVSVLRDTRMGGHVIRHMREQSDVRIKAARLSNSATWLRPKIRQKIHTA